MVIADCSSPALIRAVFRFEELLQGRSGDPVALPTAGVDGSYPSPEEQSLYEMTFNQIDKAAQNAKAVKR